MFKPYESTKPQIVPWEAKLIADCRTLSEAGELGEAFRKLRTDYGMVRTEAARIQCRALAIEISNDLSNFEREELLQIDVLISKSPVSLDSVGEAAERTLAVANMRTFVPLNGSLTDSLPTTPFPIARLWLQVLSGEERAEELRGAFSAQIAVCRHALVPLLERGAGEESSTAEAQRIGEALQYLYNLSCWVEDTTDQVWKLGKNTRGGIRYLDRKLTEHFEIKLDLPVRPDGKRP